MRASLQSDHLLGRAWMRAPRASMEEILSVEGEHAVLDGGRRWRLNAADAGQVSRALTPPAPAASITEARLRWSSWISTPLVAQAAASGLIDTARALGASDLHIEPGETSVELRLRIEGELLPLCVASLPVATRLIAALKGAAGCLPYRRDVVQEGRIPNAGVAGDVRASFVPTVLGERVALRLFGALLSLDELGLSGEVLRGLESALGAARGLLLVAGSTGAGKTTTLYAALAWLARQRGGAHLSVEDPVEQRLRLAGIQVDQVELNPARGVTAEEVLVAALRQDVDVICVGEIRTPAEAALATSAARTGRLVLAGVHAGSGAEARKRLIDLRVDAKDVDATLVAVLHQHLSSSVCGCESGCAACRGARRRRHLEAELWSPEAP